jgi:hypothetical protein
VHPGPDGPLEEIFFGGILEWRGGDTEALREIVSRLNRLGLATAELDADGGRHSLLFDDAPVPGARVDPGRLANLVDALQELVDASDDPGGAESTLHCTAVHSDGIVETLLGIEGGMVKPVSRVRARAAEEREPPAVRRTVSWRFVIPMGLLLVVGFGLMAWRSGLLDSVLSTAPDGLAIETGSFGENLAVEIDRSWGDYVIKVTRGPGYPASVEAFNAAKENATAISDRAALDILAAGGTIHVHLLDADGGLLETAPLELRPLLEDASGYATAKVHGRIGAALVKLALSKGKPKK